MEFLADCVAVRLEPKILFVIREALADLRPRTRAKRRKRKARPSPPAASGVAPAPELGRVEVEPLEPPASPVTEADVPPAGPGAGASSATPGP